ncbi:MAG: hypothetical protein EOO12_06695 [Chitinophagaceae bacterium]|nr:MAG: hypothetical protein EOO12_06695 [Chitinophagaceae bacterium]
MKKIYRVADNPFDDIEMSTPHLCNFGTDAVPKLEPEFPGESAAIRAAVGHVNSKRSSVQQLQAGHTTDTSTLDTFLKGVAATMRTAQARIAVDLGEDSKEFAALYPNGRRTYSQLTKTEAPAQLLTVKKTIESTGNRLHEATRQQLLGFHDEWERLRTGQKKTGGDLEAERDERDEGREELEDALYEALLQVARKYKRNPNAVRRYFDHTLLDPTRYASRERSEPSTP